MKTLLSFALSLLALSGFSQPIQRNYFTTNASPSTGGATNGIQIQGGNGNLNTFTNPTIIGPLTSTNVDAKLTAVSNGATAFTMTASNTLRTALVLTTNANQFLGVPLSIVSGATVTNLQHFGQFLVGALSGIDYSGGVFKLANDGGWSSVLVTPNQTNAGTLGIAGNEYVGGNIRVAGTLTGLGSGLTNTAGGQLVSVAQGANMNITTNNGVALISLVTTPSVTGVNASGTVTGAVVQATGLKPVSATASRIATIAADNTITNGPNGTGMLTNDGTGVFGWMSIPASAGGTNAIIQTNGVNVGSAGTINFVSGQNSSPTGAIASGVANIGITVTTTTSTNLAMISVGHIEAGDANFSNTVSVGTLNINTLTVTNPITGVTVSNSTLSVASVLDSSLINYMPVLAKSNSQTVVWLSDSAPFYYNNGVTYFNSSMNGSSANFSGTQTAATVIATSGDFTGTVTGAVAQAVGLKPLKATASRAAVVGADGTITNAAGTPDGTKFLRDDNTYAVPAGGSAPTIQTNGVNVGQPTVINFVAGQNSSVTGVLAGSTVNLGVNVTTTSSTNLAMLSAGWLEAGGEHLTNNLQVGGTTTNAGETTINLTALGTITGLGSGLTNVAGGQLVSVAPGANINVTTNNGVALVGVVTAPSFTGLSLSGAALSTAASASNSPANNELPTAQWVRNLFANGSIYYVHTNIDTATNPSDGVIVRQFQPGIPTNVTTQTSTAVTSGQYISDIVTTNTFMLWNGPDQVNTYMNYSGGAGGPSVTVHAELYYSYDKTNWFGDFSSADQPLTTSLALYQYVISHAPVVSTNATGFYVERRLKVGTATGATTPNVVLTIGTNSVSGSTDSAHTHIGDSGSTGNNGTAFLAANQTFTGSNVFSGGAALVGPVSIYGDSNKTNGSYISNGGEVFSNAVGSVTLFGGTVGMAGTGQTALSKVAPTNSVAVTNISGVVHMATAATVVWDCNQSHNWTHTNRIGAAMTLVITNSASGQNISGFLLGEVAGGTSRVVTIVPDTPNLIANEDTYGTALATSYAVTLTNGNFIEISDSVRKVFGATNIHFIVTRQGSF